MPPSVSQLNEEREFVRQKMRENTFRSCLLEGRLYVKIISTVVAIPLLYLKLYIGLIYVPVIILLIPLCILLIKKYKLKSRLNKLDIEMELLKSKKKYNKTIRL